MQKEESELGAAIDAAVCELDPDSALELELREFVDELVGGGGVGRGKGAHAEDELERFEDELIGDIPARLEDAVGDKDSLPGSALWGGGSDGIVEGKGEDDEGMQQGSPLKKARTKETKGREKKKRTDFAEEKWTTYILDPQARIPGTRQYKQFMNRFILWPEKVEEMADRLIEEGMVKPDCTGYCIPAYIQVMVWLRLIARGNFRDDMEDMAGVPGTWGSPSRPLFECACAILRE